MFKVKSKMFLNLHQQRYYRHKAIKVRSACLVPGDMCAHASLSSLSHSLSYTLFLFLSLFVTRLASYDVIQRCKRNEKTSTPSRIARASINTTGCPSFRFPSDSLSFLPFSRFAIIFRNFVKVYQSTFVC